MKWMSNKWNLKLIPIQFVFILLIQIIHMALLILSIKLPLIAKRKKYQFTLICAWEVSWFLSLKLKLQKNNSVFQKALHQSVLTLINMDSQPKELQSVCFQMKNTEILIYSQPCSGQEDFMEQQVSQAADQEWQLPPVGSAWWN